ncbi:MAG: alpha-ketoglutarate-dependent dioxygenase AlkB [Spongiibacteraceae bacterium]|jgi:alkylated DNA repair dioxygenase AlkB
MQQQLFAPATYALDIPDADIHYYPQFLAEPQSTYQTLLKEIQWRQDTIRIYGKPLLIPRLNAWYGDREAAYSYSGLTMKPLPWTPCLQALKQQLETYLNVQFNSVLLNHYRDGNDSVAWHSDDEPELGTAPIIASLSLGATRRFSLRSLVNKTAAPLHIDLEPGSLLVMQGSTQRCWQHQVAKTTQPTEGRINLTFRRIIGGNAAV